MKQTKEDEGRRPPHPHTPEAPRGRPSCTPASRRGGFRSSLAMYVVCSEREREREREST